MERGLKKYLKVIAKNIWSKSKNIYRGGGGRGLEWKMVRAGARGLGQGAPLGVPRGVAQRVRQRAVQVRAVAIVTIMAVMAIMATMTIAQVAIGQTPVMARVAARLLSRRLVQLESGIEKISKYSSLLLVVLPGASDTGCYGSVEQMCVLGSSSPAGWLQLIV